MFWSESPRREGAWGFFLAACLTATLIGPGLVAPAKAQAAKLSAACRDAAHLNVEGYALVVVLSPRMVYSMTEWPRLRAVAARTGFQVVTWRSREVDDTEWRAAAARAGWSSPEAEAVSPVPAACDLWVGRPNHFPYSVVIGKGREAAWPVWGVMPDADWSDTLQVRREALSRLMTDGVR